MWNRVLVAGLKPAYSKSKEKWTALATLVRLAIGFAYVPIKDHKDALDIMKKAATGLKTKKTKQFGEDFLDYFEKRWLYGKYKREEWNFYMHRGVTHNNIGSYSLAKFAWMKSYSPANFAFLLHH
jgi:hypothetical protein